MSTGYKDCSVLLLLVRQLCVLEMVYFYPLMLRPRAAGISGLAYQGHQLYTPLLSNVGMSKGSTNTYKGYRPARRSLCC
jgi:hypothetical protein